MLCNENSEINSSICMSLSEVARLSANALLVHQNNSSFLIDKLRQVYGFENVRAFGMMDECYKQNLISDKYGKLINACYGDYSTGERTEVDINDADKVEELWNGLSQLNRWSSIYCANMLFYKLRSMGIEIESGKKLADTSCIMSAVSKNSIKLTRLEHNRWVTEKLLLGFRPLFDDDKERQNWMNNKGDMKKQLKHMDIKPFYKLSQEDQNKDNDVNTHLCLLYEKVIKDII